MLNESLVIVSSILRAVALFLHILGIFCLRNQRQRKDTQKVILYNLSAIEITMQFSWSVMTIMQHLSRLHDVEQRIALSCHGGINMVFYLIMIAMTLDRLLRVILGIRYKYYVTERVIKILFTSLWIFGLVSSCPILYSIGVKAATKVIYTYGFAVGDAIFICVAMITYITIASILLTSKKKYVNRMSMSSSTNTERKTRSIRSINFLQRKQAIPLLIIITYIAFYAIPDFTLMIHHNQTLLQLATICWSIGFIVDPLIYIYLHKPTRRIALNVFRSSCRQRTKSIVMSKVR